MAEHGCPQCGGTLQPVTVGRLRDKFLRCDYCGHQIDVPDAVAIEETETFAPYTDSQGNVVTRSRRTVISRQDGAQDLDALEFHLESMRARARAGKSLIDPESVDGDPDAFVSHVRAVLGDEVGDQMAALLDQGALGDVNLNAMLAERTLEVNAHTTKRHTVTVDTGQPPDVESWLRSLDTTDGGAPGGTMRKTTVQTVASTQRSTTARGQRVGDVAFWFAVVVVASMLAITVAVILRLVA